MDLFETIEKRRSIRKFTQAPFPDSAVEKALDAALLAPNSSNVQTWDFYWVKSEGPKKKLVEACLSQSAARTASQLVVVVADPLLWKRSQPQLLEWVRNAQAPKMVTTYYEKLIPFTYRWGLLGWLTPLKWGMSNLTGLFRPILRSPISRRDIQEVAIKSAALAAENFVLAITAQGGASCMMEGFDERRVKRLLGLGRTARVVMVIGVGYEGERGTWGPRFRIPRASTVHTI